MNKLLSLMFKNRGYSSNFFDEIQKLGHPLPSHIDEMCEVLKGHHDAGDRIALYTDFDMDGLMCGVIGFAGMAELGFNVSLVMPDVSGGYGIPAGAIDKIVSDYPGTKVIVTADVGITAFDAVNRANALGLDVLITDHHVPASSLPNAHVIVDPSQSGDSSYSDICGAHVIYLVLRRYAELYGGANSGFLLEQIDRLRVFAGFGTVSDNMPVWYENRPLLRDAVSICRYVYGSGDDTSATEIPGCDIYRRAFRGLYLMLKSFADEKHANINSANEDFFGFYVAPTFNSIKRMNADVALAYNVFFGSAEAAETSMAQLMALNEARKKMVEDVYNDMMNSVQPWKPYVYVADTVPGLCGLLAQRCLSSTGIPSLVVISMEDGYHGSGRSPAWYPFLHFANNKGPWEARGHEAAFGIYFASEADIDTYVDFIKKEIDDHQPAAGSGIQPDFTISTNGDGDVDIDIDLFTDFLNELEICRPFGPGFERPSVMLRFRPAEAVWSLFGTDKQHVRASLPKGLQLVCFRQGSMFNGRIDPKFMPSVIDVPGTISLNEFAGQTSVQFMGELPASACASEEMAYADIFD